MAGPSTIFNHIPPPQPLLLLPPPLHAFLTPPPPKETSLTAVRLPILYKLPIILRRSKDTEYILLLIYIFAHCKCVMKSQERMSF